MARHSVTVYSRRVCRRDGQISIPCRSHNTAGQYRASSKNEALITRPAHGPAARVSRPRPAQPLEYASTRMIQFLLLPQRTSRSRISMTGAAASCSKS